MATFADFLAASDRDEIVLVLAQPRLNLAGFTITPSQSNTYDVDLPVFEGAASLPGGVYREVTGVRENGVDFTERTSIATVEANASSWWYDPSVAKLYVHSSTGSDPDTFTAYQAIVQFSFATKPVVLDATAGDGDTGIYHHPWVTGGLPSLIERDDDAFLGAKATSGATLGLLNGHGWWNTVIAHDGDYRWKNARVCFELGGSYRGGTQVLARADYTEFVTMRVEDVVASESLVELELKPLARELTETLPRTPIFGDDLGEGVSGTRKWVGYGRATIRPDLTDNSSHGVYTVADAAFQTLFAINSVTATKRSDRSRVALTLTTHYTVNLTTCEVTIVSSTYKWDDYEIEVDVSGKPDGSGSYLKTVGEITQDIIETFLGIPTTDIDTAAFTQADADATQEISLWIKSPRSIASILSTAQEGFPSLERSVQANLGQTLDGKWTINIWDPTVVTAGLPTLRKGQFTLFRPEPTLESVFGAVTVYYAQNHFDGSWQTETATNTEVQFRQDTEHTLHVYSFLRESGPAQTLAQRLLQMTGGLALSVAFEETGVTMAAKRVRDRVLVDYDPAPVAAGLLDQAPFEFIELRRTFSPTLVVSGVMQNLRGLSGDLGVIVAAGSPDYSSSTAAERKESGYVCDTNGEAAPGDPDSRNVSLIW